MNKFLTFPGKQPVYLGDIDFMQNSVAAVFSEIARALVDSENDSLNAILQGVELGAPIAGRSSWTAGIVVIDGEILPVEAGSAATVANDSLYLHVVSILSGERTFKDGQDHECYETRSAEINTESEGGIQVTSLVRFGGNAFLSSAFSGDLQGGTLYYKSGGLWFLELNINPSNAANPLSGTVTFGPLADHFFGKLNTGSFNDWLIKSNPMIFACSISKQTGNYVEISINGQAPGFTGSARYAGLIPIF